MKYLFTLILLSSLFSCNSDDNSNNNKCSGTITYYENEQHHYIDIVHDCSECYKLTTWTCPEPGTCEYESITGVFECNQ